MNRVIHLEELRIEAALNLKAEQKFNDLIENVLDDDSSIDSDDMVGSSSRKRMKSRNRSRLSTKFSLSSGSGSSDEDSDDIYNIAYSDDEMIESSLAFIDHVLDVDDSEVNGILQRSSTSFNASKKSKVLSPIKSSSPRSNRLTDNRDNIFSGSEYEFRGRTSSRASSSSAAWDRKMEGLSEAYEAEMQALRDKINRGSPSDKEVGDGGGALTTASEGGGPYSKSSPRSSIGGSRSSNDGFISPRNRF